MKEKKMKKQYTKKQIQETINYWKKQLKSYDQKIVSESQYEPWCDIEIYDICFADVGTTTDVAQQKHKSLKIEVNANKNLLE